MNVQKIHGASLAVLVCGTGQVPPPKITADIMLDCCSIPGQLHANDWVAHPFVALTTFSGAVLAWRSLQPLMPRDVVQVG